MANILLDRVQNQRAFQPDLALMRGGERNPQAELALAGGRWGRAVYEQKRRGRFLARISLLSRNNVFACRWSMVGKPAVAGDEYLYPPESA